MQHEKRTQQERTDATRAALLTAGRELFVAKGYADTSTPELVAATGLTRGALYHHFADKRALFAAVVETEARAVAEDVERQSLSGSPIDMLLAGSEAYLEAMAKPGRTRLLLVEGPAALGQSEMAAIDTRHGNRTLKEGLAAAIKAGALVKLPLDALTAQLAALFDRAALGIAAGDKPDEHRRVIVAILNGLRP